MMKLYQENSRSGMLRHYFFYLYPSISLSRDEDALAKVPDPDAVKPDGWLDDEPEFVSDPTAEKPEDW